MAGHVSSSICLPGESNLPPNLRQGREEQGPVVLRRS